MGKDLFGDNTIQNFKDNNINTGICSIVLKQLTLNSFPTGDDFCHLLITFANSLDSNQAEQNVGPDLDPNCLTL